MKTFEYYMALPYRMEIIPDMVEGGFTAWYPDLPGCLTCSETMEGIISEPDLSEYSGQFKLRMPKSLHRSLSMHAKNEGCSMNQYCLYLLSKNDAVHTAQNA